MPLLGGGHDSSHRVLDAFSAVGQFAGVKLMNLLKMCLNKQPVPSAGRDENEEDYAWVLTDSAVTCKERFACHHEGLRLNSAPRDDFVSSACRSGARASRASTRKIA